MRGLRIGFGLSTGLFVGLLGLSLGQCSFYLPERALCTDGSCTPKTDMAPLPPDMAKDPNDPSLNGAYMSTTIGFIPPTQLLASLLLAPSTDGTTIAAGQFPLVIIAPPKGVMLDPMRPYADRLVSHGFVVGMYVSSDQTYDPNYRDAGLEVIDSILGTPPTVRDHIDGNKIGLVGYELSAKIHTAVAVARNTTPPIISGLFLIDPTDFLSPTPRIDGPGIMAQLRLPNNNTVVMLGEPRSVMDPNPCIAKPQKSYIDFYNVAQSPVLAITFGGANLADFINGYPDTACAAGSTAPPAQTQALAIKYATAYMQWTLKGSTRAREYLLGADYATDAQAASLSQLMK